jgi:predicted nucleotidyltransferase
MILNLSPKGGDVRTPRPNYGGFGSDQRTLSALIERLVAAFDPEAIYLFGSRARGDATPFSDFDLMMITRSDEDVTSMDLAEAYAPVQGLGIACEVIPCSRKTFERERHARTGICQTVAREGRLVYERR